MRLHKDCAWYDVTVDTRLPARAGAPAFGRAERGREGAAEQAWVALAEKAYAKLHGSYAAIGGGPLPDAMADLTGGVTESVDLASPEGLARVASGELWRTLQDCNARGHLIGCALHARGARAPAHGGGAAGADAGGVRANHAYAVLDVQTLAHCGTRLLRVRNPWGADAGWAGEWSARSAVWVVHPTAAKQLGFSRAADDAGGAGGADGADAGAFWIAWEDFVAAFNRVHLCRVFPPHWHSLVVRAEWAQHSCGGAPSEPTWFLNPQFRLLAPHAATAACLTISQADPRLPGRSNGSNGRSSARLVGLSLFAAPHGEFPARVWRPADAELVAEAPAQEARDVSLFCRLLPGRLYFAVPHTALAGQTAGAGAPKPPPRPAPPPPPAA